MFRIVKKKLPHYMWVGCAGCGFTRGGVCFKGGHRKDALAGWPIFQAKVTSGLGL